MARYIDINEIKFTGAVFEDRDGEIYIKLSDVKQSIEQTPTADAVEVKHGEWIDDGDCFHCSVCNKTYQLGSLQTIYDVKRCWQYCANCGAKMDGTLKERGGEK